MYCELKPRTTDSCGEECQYTYYHHNNSMTIEGNGEMKSYSEEIPSPWNIKKDELTNVYFNGITSIG